MDELNKQRRSIEQEITVHATQQAEAQLEENPDLLVLVIADKSYNEGVLGIVAGRLKELFARPVFVLAVSPDNIAKGSGRSIRSIALGSLVLAARQSGILLTGGGHDMAAGASLQVDKLEEFRAFLAQKISAHIAVLPQREFEITATNSVAGCTFDLVRTIESCGPFGSGQPEPTLLLTHISVSQVKWVGTTKSHFTALLDDGTSRPLKSIMFNVAGTKIGNLLKSVNELGPLKVLGKLKRDEWRGGKSVQFLIEDIARQFD